MGRYADASYLQYESHLQRTLVPYSLANVAHALTHQPIGGTARFASAVHGNVQLGSRPRRLVTLERLAAE